MAGTDPARVFISCGQATGAEIAVAQNLAKCLETLGFVPYVAVEQHTLLAIRENVFPQLRDTEYFVFVDFRREALGRSKQYRGSLFSHQELAIASYLEKDFVGFQVKGVRRLDGLIGNVQASCLEFVDRSDLPDLLVREIKKRGWQSEWRNQLVVGLNNPPYDDARRVPENVDGRFFHLRVLNRHRYRTAQDCVGYVRSIVDRSTGEAIPFESVELKWAGYMFPSATIAPSSFRKLDAFWLPHPAPTNPQFNCFADSTRFIPRFQGLGEWRITYEVLSSTILGGMCSILVTLRPQIDRVVVSPDTV